MEDRFIRTERLLGADALERLKKAHVAVFGVGGVGGYVVEALARCGVGNLTLVDSDCVAPSNINRQIIALCSTVGKKKVDVAAERARDINPDITVHVKDVFYLPETSDQFDFSQYDYVVDAIDTVSGKMELVKRAREAGVPIICSMGAGYKLDPSAFEVADIYKTSVCPLAKSMRSLCRKAGIEHLKVVYSKETPIADNNVEGTEESAEGQARKRISPASAIFAPAAAGLVLAREVVRDISGV